MFLDLVPFRFCSFIIQFHLSTITQYLLFLNNYWLIIFNLIPWISKLQQETVECLEHALIVARTSSGRHTCENNVRHTFVTRLLVAGKHSLLIETLSKMTTDDRSSCCHKLIFFIEGTLNNYVKRSLFLSSLYIFIIIKNNFFFINSLFRIYFAFPSVEKKNFVKAR